MPKLDWTKPLNLKQGYSNKVVSASYVGKIPTGEVVVHYSAGCYATVHPETGVSIFDHNWVVSNRLAAWEKAYAAEPEWCSEKAFNKAGWDAAMREHKSD